MLLKEEFFYNIGALKDKYGKLHKVAYIDLKQSQNTFSIKNEITKYGAKYNKPNSWFYWDLGNNPEYVINSQVKPCIQNLTKFENMNGKPRRNVIATIDELINKLKNASVPNVGQTSNKDDILNELEGFKNDLIKITSSEEFKEKMEPIIRFRSANNYQYSFLNTILILAQDPEATLVKPGGAWKKYYNRTIEPGAKPIFMWIPKGERGLTHEEKEELKRKFLLKKKVKKVSELSVYDKELLDKKLKKTQPETFDLAPYWYDYRFTVQMPNTENLIGNPGHNLKWFNDDGKEIPDTISKVNALLNVIENEGIKVSYVNIKGGARGRSKSGEIEVLKNQPKDIEMLNTLVHEFAHELLHQTYAKDKNPELKEYFVGTEEGTAVVEQQAELCAWIVLRSFGYDADTNINYVGIWGLNQDNCVKVFDTVSKVSTFISQQIIKTEKGQTEDMFESKKYMTENNIPSGYEIAKMIGCGNIYKKSAMKQQQKNNVVKLTENQLYYIIKESVNKVLKKCNGNYR